jgi:excisionase family DNA binding protein
MPATKRYFSCNEAAEYTGTKSPTWRKWIAERRVTVVRLGRAVRIPVEEVERLLSENTVPAREAR